jgi:hypothetical protein
MQQKPFFSFSFRTESANFETEPKTFVMWKQSWILIAALALAVPAWSQGIKTPAPSPHQIITQDFGLSQLTIDYSRPSVKGRTIFGGLVPFDKVWRTGANAVTTLAFGDDVQLDGHEVKAGKYALYTIPSQGGDWTIILNRDVKNWGTQYSEKDDVLRFKVSGVQLPFQIETLTINVDAIRDTSAILYLAWDHTYVPIRLTTQVDSAIMTEISRGMQGAKKPYAAAARYYMNSGRDLHQALDWVNEALKASPAANNFYLKAQIQAKMNDKSGAEASARQGIEAARKAGNKEYEQMNQKLLDSLH